MGSVAGRRRTGAAPPGFRPSAPRGTRIPVPPAAHHASSTVRATGPRSAAHDRHVEHVGEAVERPAPACRRTSTWHARTWQACRMAALPPLPPEPAAVQTARWLLRPIAFMESCRRRLGDPFGVTLVGFQSPLYMASDPDVVRALYTGREHGLPPGRSAALLPMVGSRSLLLLEGREHLARRRLMLPPFHGERMRAYETIVREAALAELERWPADAAFPLHPSMQAITLEVILRAVFGVTDDGRRGRLAARLRGLLDATSSPTLQIAVLLSRRIGKLDPLVQVRGVRGEIDALLYAEIADRRRDPQAGERDDILSMLAGARFEDGDAMSDGELRDQLMTLLLAGHETTATALAWTFDLLARHPQALERLTREVDAGEQAYLRAVIAESLRLRPVLGLAGRRLAHEMRIGEYTLPAGSDITPAIWLTHTRADLYRSRTRSGRSDSSAAPRRPTRGSRSAVGSGGASAPRSRSSRCAWCWRPCCATG